MSSEYKLWKLPDVQPATMPPELRPLFDDAKEADGETKGKFVVFGSTTKETMDGGNWECFDDAMSKLCPPLTTDSVNVVVAIVPDDD